MVSTTLWTQHQSRVVLIALVAALVLTAVLGWATVEAPAPP